MGDSGADTDDDFLRAFCNSFSMCLAAPHSYLFFGSSCWYSEYYFTFPCMIDFPSTFSSSSFALPLLFFVCVRLWSRTELVSTGMLVPFLALAS